MHGGRLGAIRAKDDEYTTVSLSARMIWIEDELLLLPSVCVGWVYVWVYVWVGWDYPRAYFHETHRPTGQLDISQQKRHSHTKKLDECVCVSLISMFDYSESVYHPSVCLSLCLSSVSLFTLELIKLHFLTETGALMRNVFSLLGATVIQVQLKQVNVFSHRHLTGPKWHLQVHLHAVQCAATEQLISLLARKLVL